MYMKVFIYYDFSAFIIYIFHYWRSQRGHSEFKCDNTHLHWLVCALRGRSYSRKLITYPFYLYFICQQVLEMFTSKSFILTGTSKHRPANVCSTLCTYTASAFVPTLSSYNLPSLYKTNVRRTLHFHVIL